MSIQTAITRLTDAFAARCVTSNIVREHHSGGEAYPTRAMPDAVLYPHTTTEVQRIVGICAEEGCPIVPFGIGSSLEGHVVPVRGGISLDMTQMDKILAVHPEDLDAVVQPGVTRRRLNEELRDTGLFFAVDPGADASIGGMTATRASGTNAVRYGTMRENVMGLEAVLADGRVIRTGSRARKSSSGYDLCKMMIGSEGTLGIITEVTVRLFGQPEAVSSAVCGFETVEGAVQSVILAIQSGLPVARIEFLDDLQIQAANAYSNLELTEQITLFLEFHGSDAGVAEQAERFGEIAEEFGGRGFEWATKTEERNRLWRARHDAFYAVKAQRPGAAAVVTDACVPISRLAEALLETRKDTEESGLYAPMVGHVGDGNFHVQMMVDPEDKAEMSRAYAVAERLAERTLALGGTVSGEHGIGLGKIKYMQSEHGDGVEVMRAIKRALDPQNILNPGKMVEGN